MYQLTYVNFYDQKTTGFYNTMQELTFYIEAHSLFTGEKHIKDLHIKFLTLDEYNALEAE
jgi:hypothetical protein